jgi:hypothetical protein
MQTHERNVLMWVAGKLPSRPAFWIVLVIILWAIILFTSCESPTSTTAVEHPNEEIITLYSKCYYKHLGLEEKLGGPLTVAFSTEKREVKCPAGCNTCPADGKCIAAGWAMPYSKMVTYYKPWVRDPARKRVDLSEAAAHEISHISGPMAHDSVFWETMEKLIDETAGGGKCFG